MTFLHPPMLAWTAVAAGPVVLHLLNRGRTRTVAWGAMMFLSPGGGGTDHRARLREWFTPLVRSLAIASFAVAAARPVVGGRFVNLPTAGLTTGGPTDTVLVLDTSSALGYTVNGRTRMDQSRELALQLLAGLGRDDRAGLTTTPNDFDSVAPTADVQSVATRVADLRPGRNDADLAAALDRAAGLFDRSTPPELRRIFVVCDRHASAWKNATADFGRAWKRSTPPAVVVFPVGGEEADNVAVESIRVEDGPVVRDRPTSVDVTIRNLGPDPETNVLVTVFTPTHTLAETAVTIAARSSVVVHTMVKFPDLGSHVLSAAVASTGLTADDRRDFAVDVVDALRVLVVTDDAGGFDATALATAMAPYTAAGRRSAGDAVVTSVTDRSWPTQPLRSFDAVILDGADLPADHRRDVETFVLDGGGLVVFPGAVGVVDLGGTVPFVVGPVERRPTTLKDVDRRHPVWQFLGDGPVPVLSVADHFKPLGMPADGRVIGRWVDGDPFAVEIGDGRGRVVCFTATVNSLAEWPGFLPVLQAATRHVAGARGVDRNPPAGRPIAERVDPSIDDGSATVQRLPANARVPATITRFGDFAEIRFGDTRTAGTYRLRYRTGGRDHMENFVVGPWTGPADLTPMTDDRWRAVCDLTGGEKVEPTPAAVAAVLHGDHGGREIWIELVVLGVVLTTVDTVASKS